MLAISALAVLLAMIPHTHALGRLLRALSDNSQDWKLHVIAYCMLPVYWLPVTSLFLALSRLWDSSLAFPRQPGHWLLIQCGVAILERLGLLALYPPREEGYLGPYNAAPLLIAASFLPGCISAAIADLYQAEEKWRRVFVVMRALRLVILVPTAANELFLLDAELVWIVAGMISVILSVAWIVSFLFAVREESPQQASDRLHVAGIVLYLFDTVSLWPLFLVMVAWVEL
jgi:hypothetical protein